MSRSRDPNPPESSIVHDPPTQTAQIDVDADPVICRTVCDQRIVEVRVTDDGTYYATQTDQTETTPIPLSTTPVFHEFVCQQRIHPPINNTVQTKSGETYILITDPDNQDHVYEICDGVTPQHNSTIEEAKRNRISSTEIPIPAHEDAHHEYRIVCVSQYESRRISGILSCFTHNDFNTNRRIQLRILLPDGSTEYHTFSVNELITATRNAKVEKPRLGAPRYIGR